MKSVQALVLEQGSRDLSTLLVRIKFAKPF